MKYFCILQSYISIYHLSEHVNKCNLKTHFSIIHVSMYRVSKKKVRFSLEAYISASRVSNDKTKTTIGKVFQRAFQNSP